MIFPLKLRVLAQVTLEMISKDKTIPLELNAETIVYISNKLMVNLSNTFRKCPKRRANSGGSRQNVDRVLSQKNLAKNEIFVHFHSKLEILTGFQKP